MEYIAVYAMSGFIVVMGLICGAYVLGRHLGRQEQFLKDIKREHKEHQAEVLRKQEEMEEAWAAYYAEHQRQVDAAQTPLTPDSPKPTEPENVRKLERRASVRER